MTIQGAIAELQNLLNADDVPMYYKGGIEKVIETIAMEFDKDKPSDSEKPNNCEDDEYWKHLFIEVAEGRMSDAGANQAWYEYINHEDEPQTERGK